MKVQRCPECGGRLTRNYCDACMRRVTLRDRWDARNQQESDASSAHREEGHECVSFDFPEQTLAQPRNRRKQAVLAVLAVGILLMAVFAARLMMEDTDWDYVRENYVVSADVPQIAATELYNDGGIVITADSAGLYHNDYAISVTIQNHSLRRITVSLRDVSVNGYMIDSSVFEEVGALQSRKVLLVLKEFRLESAGITQIAEMIVDMEIYCSSSYESLASIEAITLQTDLADQYEQVVDDSGWEMYRDGEVRVILRDMQMQDGGRFQMEIFFENMSEYSVYAYIGTALINGQECSGIIYDRLRSGTRTVDSFSTYDLEEMNITQIDQIEEISVVLEIKNMEDGPAEKSITQTITFTPEEILSYLKR